MDVVSVIQQHASYESLDNEYIKRLCSMPQSLLKTEQNTLKATRGSILESQQHLGESHVADFTATQQNIDRLETLTRLLDQAAKESLEVSLATPRIPERSFKGINTLLENDLQVYENIDKVQEFLSLPELVKDRVMDGEYGQALDLASLTKRLLTRYPKSVLVLQLAHNVQQSVDSMREILLRSLKEASKLSQLTKSVTYLRRMEHKDLEMVFIDSRTIFLEKEQWGAIPVQLKQTQPFAYLKRFVDIYREHVFATINGFRVIFQKKNTDDKDEAPLGIFARKTLTRLLTELKEYAPKITSKSDRTSLWLQLAFCSRSMGRVGSNFWYLLDSDILSKEEWEEAEHHQQDMARKATRYTK